MVKQLKNPIPKETDRQPLFRLAQTSIDRINKISEDIPKVRASLDDLEKLGLDVSVLRDQIDWADKAREVLLKNVGLAEEEEG